jgi:hypothetical protein
VNDDTKKKENNSVIVNGNPVSQEELKKLQDDPKVRIKETEKEGSFKKLDRMQG